MSTRKPKTAKGTRTAETNVVTLSCRAPSAQAVFVAGTFNDWHPEATPMIRGDEGEWSVALNLPPGRHELKFLVDGEWCCEPGRDDADLSCACVSNPFGTMNRVLEVPSNVNGTQP